jgi:serine/threonine-protein kinase HipA
MAELAKNVVERSVAVPGVQPKISLSLIREAIENKRRERLPGRS